MKKKRERLQESGLVVLNTRKPLSVISVNKPSEDLSSFVMLFWVIWASCKLKEKLKSKLMKMKNTKEMVLNHKGTSLVKDGVKISANYKWRTWNIQAKLSKIHKPLRSIMFWCLILGSASLCCDWKRSLRHRVWKTCSWKEDKMGTHRRWEKFSDIHGDVLISM